MFKYLVFLGIVVFILTYLMVCSNPHDYQNKQYHKLYTLSFIPSEYRVKAQFYHDDIEKEYTYPYILKPYLFDSFSIGVKKINNKQDYIDYFKVFCKNYTMIEEYTNYENEVGITYIKTDKQYDYKTCVKRLNLYGMDNRVVFYETIY